MWTINYSHDDQHWEIRAGWIGPIYATASNIKQAINTMASIEEEPERYRSWWQAMTTLRQARVTERVQQLREKRCQ